MVNKSIKKVERLKDQGSNGSPAYEFATKISKIKSVIVVRIGSTNRTITHWCNPPLAPPYPST